MSLLSIDGVIADTVSKIGVSISVAGITVSEARGKLASGENTSTVDYSAHFLLSDLEGVQGTTTIQSDGRVLVDFCDGALERAKALHRGYGFGLSRGAGASSASIYVCGDTKHVYHVDAFKAINGFINMQVALGIYEELLFRGRREEAVEALEQMGVGLVVEVYDTIKERNDSAGVRRFLRCIGESDGLLRDKALRMPVQTELYHLVAESQHSDSADFKSQVLELYALLMPKLSGVPLQLGEPEQTGLTQLTLFDD